MKPNDLPIEEREYWYQKGVISGSKRERERIWNNIRRLDASSYIDDYIWKLLRDKLKLAISYKHGERGPSASNRAESPNVQLAGKAKVNQLKLGLKIRRKIERQLAKSGK